ncbi:hypothetical protein EI555_002210 [Monodon monoceros]|uniref:Protein FAM136A n=1 Tax=Monodon monoceros TaxID=40151 RepID=A0A4U1FN61_MONMO|nr:hypothetical protein EI555_002210 [Monodon monoceros]
MQGLTFRCSTGCCEDGQASMQQVHQRIERCRAPLAQAQALVTCELEKFQDRLALCTIHYTLQRQSQRFNRCGEKRASAGHLGKALGGFGITWIVNFNDDPAEEDIQSVPSIPEQPPGPKRS